MKISIFLFLILFSSCNFPTHYFSPEPDCEGKVMPLDQKEYLSKCHPSDFRYFFKTFEKRKNDPPYMITNFRNDSLCFDVKILVQKLGKLAGMKRTNGKSYPKELYDLKWEIRGNEIVYLDMHDIID